VEWRSEPRGNGSVVERIGIAKRSGKKVEEKACVPDFLLLRFSQMNEVFRYRSRSFNAEDIAGLRSLIAQNPTASRRKLSSIVCEAWGWRQSNGALCDMVCRSLMLALQRAGHIELPEKRQSPHNGLAQRRRPATDFLMDRSPVECPFGELPPLTIRQVRRTEEECLFNGLMESHHYLGYTQPVGEHLKHMVCAGNRPVACLGWSSAPWHIGPRDRFIGWTPAVRRQNLHLIAYNTRFLILPWVKVKHLASHILGLAMRNISNDWQKAYGHPIHYLESFVDTQRFAGTCYKAANWICLGQTTGRGIKDKKHIVSLSLKDVLGYPLSKDFRSKLCGGQTP
jgi:hypothetical protein